MVQIINKITLLVASVLAPCLIARASDSIQQFPLSRQAQQGDAHAQYKMALRWLQSKTTDSSIRNAEECLRKASEQGQFDAQLLNSIYSIYIYMSCPFGNLDRILHEARVIYQLADQGCAEAKILIGILESIFSNEILFAAENAAWLHEEAEHGNADAKLALEIIRFFDSVEINKNAAWLHEEAEHGNADAKLALGIIQFFEKNSNNKNRETALNTIRLLAENGHTFSQLVLGLMIYTGEGVDQSEQEGIVWVKKSAEQGNSYAQLLMAAYMYEGSETVEKSENDAKIWFQKSLELGNPIAHYLVNNPPAGQEILFERFSICTSKERVDDSDWYGLLDKICIVSLVASNGIMKESTKPDKPIKNDSIDADSIKISFSTPIKITQSDYGSSPLSSSLSSHKQESSGNDPIHNFFIKTVGNDGGLKFEHLGKVPSISPDGFVSSYTGTNMPPGIKPVSKPIKITQSDFGPSPSSSSLSSHKPTPPREQSIPAHLIKTVSNGKGPGYKPLERATLIAPDGRVSSYTGTNIPAGMKPVVCHPGRVDNGTHWGKHIEYVPMTRKENAMHVIKNTDIVGDLGTTAISGIKDFNEGDYAKGTIKTAASIGVILLILNELFSD